jgi:hypothetical protein
MKNKSNRMAMAATDLADTVAQGRPSGAAPFSGGRALVDREQNGVTLLQGDNLGARPASHGFGHHEFTPGEVSSGFGEQDGDLQRKDAIPVQVLVQAVIVAGTVFKDQRCGAGLSSLMTAL